MYCKECGNPLSDLASVCPNCGAPVNSVPTDNSQKICPETHLTRAIILTILCCLPLGIPAIVYAAGVENAFYSGNYNLAVEKSKKAEKLCDITLIFGIIYLVIYFIVVAVLSATGISD